MYHPSVHMLDALFASLASLILPHSFPSQPQLTYSRTGPNRSLARSLRPPAVSCPLTVHVALCVCVCWSAGWQGMVVSVGRVRPCPLLSFKFVLCSHNTVLGAAGGSIENAELAVARGLI